MAPSRTRPAALAALLTLLLGGLVVLVPTPPASGEYDEAEVFATETIYTASAGDFAGRDASLALRPDGAYVEVFLTPDEDTTYPLTLLARTGEPGSWGPLEVVTDDADDAAPYSVEAFAAPDGSVVALWLVVVEGQAVLRSATRAPGGGWSEPVVVGSGSMQVRELFRGPQGATAVWIGTDGTLHSRTWTAGGWLAPITAPGDFPTSYQSLTWAVRDSDGQITVAAFRDQTLRLSQLDPGEGWSDPVLSHRTYDNCETDVGVLDQYGNIRTVVTLCYQHHVIGYQGLAYGEDGDLHVWWNSTSGMSRVQGFYPNHQVVCDCTPGVSGGVAPGGDLAPVAGVATLASGALLPGMPRSVDPRGFHKVWDEDGDLTMFVGGLGDAGRTINVYREGGTFDEPVATFQAPGSNQSSRSGYVVDTFVSGDDVLVAYQHSAPAGNLGPGGSCNTRVLHADDTLSEPLGACLDGNTDDTTAVQAPDGSVAIASASVRYFYFHRLLASDGPGPPQPVAASIALGGPAPTYGAAGSVRAAVTGAGRPAAGTVRLRYGGAVLATAPLAADGTAVLPIGRTALVPGSRTLVVDYLGSDAVLPGSASRTVTVGRALPQAPAVVVTKRPTARKPGRVRVTLGAPAAGLAVPSGPVTVLLRKGAQARQKTGTLTEGVVTVTVPKLARGRWRLTASYAGDVRYRARTGPAVTLKVKR